VEARGLNNQNGKSGLYFLDPNINLLRDPRWGRAQEVPGECATLTAEFAARLVHATQFGIESTPSFDNNTAPKYLLAAATIKHFSMYDNTPE
jgi:beta-glucosidase-like glycosyl hydrolase